ncbi:hypothetical protein RYA05_01425 [Pseudomonas syringae pv. actinidiae]|nr:hypothetical protein [Pseudomonas syringae pv. actinidiae]
MSKLFSSVKPIFIHSMMCIGILAVAATLAYIYTSEEKITYKNEVVLKVIEANKTSPEGDQNEAYSIKFEDANQRFPIAYNEPQGVLTQSIDRACFKFYKEREGQLITLVEQKGVEKSLFGEIAIDRSIENGGLYKLACRKAWMIK